jgi:hypothetical protein
MVAMYVLSLTFSSFMMIGAQLKDIEFGVVASSGNNALAATGVMGLQKDSPVLKALKDQGYLEDVFFSMSLNGDFVSGTIAADNTQYFPRPLD